MLRFLKNEPLVHFLGLAALLFVANAFFAGDQRETITITSDAQDFLVSEREALLLRPLTAEERRGVIEDFIEEEILVREARDRGLDSSSRIRTLLIQNMRLFLASDLPVASEEELRRHYQANPERFTTSERFTYDHVLFRDRDAVPGDTLERLRAGANHRDMGDRRNTQSRLLGVDAQQIALAFGPTEAPRILAVDDTDWHGPYYSSEGAHFLRIAERSAPRTPDFESIRDWVENDWLDVERRYRVDAALADMRGGYRIVVESLSPPQ